MSSTTCTLDIDLREIFVGREEQREQFKRKLNYWIQYTADANSSGLEIPPSPEDQIQGLVVLLTGLGGIGKTQLLKRYYHIARMQSENKIIQLSEIVDWEFAIGNNKLLFIATEGGDIDVTKYFRLMHTQLAKALGKGENDFKKYRTAERTAIQAKNQAQSILERLLRGEEYVSLRSVAVDGILALIQSLPLGLSSLANNKAISSIIKGAASAGVDIGVDKIKQMLTSIQQYMGKHFNDYVDAESKLGISLGQDLARFAQGHPILIFFDTYELMAEGDGFLRMIMGAAGPRVGWVIAGRRQLWKRKDIIFVRNEHEYGYEDLVPPSRSIGIDLSENKAGNFGPHEIRQFFNELYSKVKAQRPTLLKIEDETIRSICEITLGIPLAVSIAASIYLETGKFDDITKSPSGRDMVQEMVERYLKHVRNNRRDRLCLYALALLRRTDEVIALLAALKVSGEQMSKNPREQFNEDLRRLQRRYGFIFTSQEKPALHEDVRRFMRPWLLRNRTNNPDAADIQEIAKRLKDVHYQILEDLEEEHKYPSLHQRLNDERWVGKYLDLTEQVFWVDPDDGVRYLLPFMLAASIYRREENQEAQAIGDFFKDKWGRSSQRLWNYAYMSLTRRTNFYASDKEIHALRELAVEIEKQELTFPPLVQAFPTTSASLEPASHDVLLAAIWWRLGEAYRVRDPQESVNWYRMALEQLPKERELRETYEEAKVVYEGLKVIEKRAKEIAELISNDPHRPEVLSLLIEQGDIYAKLGNYQKSRECYSQVLEIDNSLASIYAKLGETYLRQKEYRSAIDDLNKALDIDPSVASVYAMRGEAYMRLGEIGKAEEDVEKVLSIEPDNEEISKKLEKIRKLKEPRGKPDQPSLPGEQPVDPSPPPPKMSRRRVLTIAALGGAVVFGAAIAGAELSLHHIDSQLLSRPQITLTPSYNMHNLPLVYSGHTAAVNSVTWSSDGQYIASASDDHTVQVWNASSSIPLFTYRGHSEPVNSVAWSPDGKYIASASDDHTVQIWEASSGTPLSTCHGHTQGVNSVVWSPDGTRIASASRDKTVCVWNAVSGTPLSVLHGHSQVVWGVAWSPDGTHIASASGDKTVRVWNIVTSKVDHTYQDHTDMVVSVAWSPDGKYIASASYDKTVLIYDSTNGAKSFTYRGHTNYVTSVAWSLDSKRITSGSYVQTAQVWDALTGKNVLIYRYPIGAVYDIAWSSDGKRIASASNDHTVQVWDASVGTTTIINREHTGIVWSAIWSPSAKYIASASDDTTVRVWDSSKGTVAIIFRGHTKATYGLAWSPNGKRIASTSLDTTVQIWDPFTGNVQYIYKGHTGAVRGVAWSLDGKLVASAGDDKIVRIWDPSTGKLFTVYRNHSDTVFSLAWSPDGKYIASASKDKTIQVWNASTGDTRTTYHGHNNTVLSVAWSPEGNSIASASLDGTVQVWNAFTGTPLITYRGHTQAVESVSWSQDGKYIASASDDTTVQVWDISTGSNIFIYQKHANAVNDATWSPNGQFIASASSDKTVQVWQSPLSLT